MFLGPNFVACSSKKQLLLAHSSTGSEYQALAHKTSEVLWIKSIVQELFIPYLPPKLLCGKLSVFMISHNPILHARTKHIKLDIHFVREIVNGNKLHIQYVPAQAQISDILTKILSTNLFVNLETNSRLFPSTICMLCINMEAIGFTHVMRNKQFTS